MPTQDRKNLVGYSNLEYDKDPNRWYNDYNPFPLRSKKRGGGKSKGRPVVWSGKKQNYDFYFYTDFEIAGEICIIPYHIIAPDYDTAKSRLRSSVDRYHFKDSNKDEHDRLIAFIKHSKIRIDGQKNKAGDDVLRDITDPE